MRKGKQRSESLLVKHLRVGLGLVAFLIWIAAGTTEARTSSIRGRPLKVLKHSKAVQIPKRLPPASFLHKEASASIDAWLARPELANSLVGVDLMDIASGEELICFNGRRRFTPASTAKLFVTACAYETLGPAFTYKTRFCTKGTISGERLDSDVLVAPSQDPTFSRGDLTQMLIALKARGIHEISGKFVLADVPGGGERFVAEWMSEDWAQDWMPVSSSLVIDRNVSSPSFLASAKSSVSGAAESTNALSKTLLASDYTPGWLSFENNSHSVSVWRAKSPDGSQPLKVVANPDAYNMALVNDMAGQLGIKAQGHANWFVGLRANSVLIDHESAPLARILKTTLKESDNLYAQQILRTLGLSQPSKDSKNPLNLEQRGLQKIISWLETLGVPSHEVVLWDGCGLSRKDCISPHALNTVLRHMALHAETSSYLALLNRATISPQGSFQFKTGAMDSVRGITGILENFEGRRFAFTVLINGHSPSVSELRTSIGALINQLAQAQMSDLKKTKLEPTKKIH